MSNKFGMELSAFLARVNKKSQKHSGKRVRFGWVKRKRK